MSTTTAKLPGRVAGFWRARGAHSPVGVEAGEHHMRIAQWRVRRNLRTWQATGVRLPEGAGNPQKTHKTIRAAMRSAGIAPDRAVCMVCTPRVDVFPLTVRQVPGESLDRLVAKQAIEQLNYPPEEAVIDYARLPAEATRDSDQATSVIVFTAPRALAESLVRTLDRAGCEVERLMTPACALAAALAKGGADERHLVLLPTEEATSVAIVEGGSVLLERILPWSVQGIVGHMRSELDLREDQCRKLLSQEADPGAALIEPAAVGMASGGLGSLEGALREILGPFLQELAREALGCVGYSDSFLRRRRVSGVVLTGPMAGNALLREYIGKASELPFVELEGLAGLPRRGECAEDFVYAPAAGCAVWLEEVGA